VTSQVTRGRGEAVMLLPLFRSQTQTQALVLTRLGKEVNVHVVTATSWASSKDDFLAGVKARALVPVPMGDPEGDEPS
jgi:hypothetical protein